MAVIEFQGTTYEVPDGMSDDQIRQALTQDASKPPNSEDEPAPEVGVTPTTQYGIQEGEDLGFMDGLVAKEGFFKGLADESIVAKAGGQLLEALPSSTPGMIVEGIAGDSIANLAKANREAKIYEKWQPQIWDAEDRLNNISDRNSPQYQAAWEELRLTRKNFTDDMNGTYAEDTSEFDFSEFKDTLTENPGFVTGSLLKSLLADPELLIVPGGWVKAGAAAVRATKNANKLVQASAKLAAQTAGATSIGAPMGAAADIITQRDESPNAPIDAQRVMNATIDAGTISALLPVVGAAGKAIYSPVQKRLSEVADAKTIKAIEKDAQKIYLGGLREDGPPLFSKQAAVNKAIAARAGHKDFSDNLPDMDIYMSDAAIANRRALEDAKGPVGKAVDNLVNAKKSVGEGFNYLTQPITSTLRAMGLPHVARDLDIHDMNLGTAIDDKQSIVEVFSKEFGKLSPDEQAVAALNINNGTLSEVSGSFSDEFNTAFSKVRKMLDDEFDEMQDVGMKVGKTENYFPREMDYEAFLKSRGVDPAMMNKPLADKINSKLNLSGRDKLAPSDMTQDNIRKHLTEREVAEVVARQASGTPPTSTVTSSTNNVKSRSVDVIDPENMKFYVDPRAALHNHVNRITPKIHDRRFFGGKKIDKDNEGLPGTATDDDFTNAYIKDYVARLHAEGEVPGGDLDKVVKVLQARFVGAKQRAKPWINGTKNLLYAATLGNPVAATTQLGDIGAAQYLNVTRGIDSLIGEATVGTRFTMKEFGLDAIPELESLGATRTILNWSLRAGGFRAMDRLGKETILNSTYKKLRDVTRKSRELEEMAKNDPIGFVANPKLQKQLADETAKTYQYFKTRYGARLGDDEVQLIIDGIKSGDTKNPHARLAMYSDLTRVQPVSMSQMPIGYLNNPNMRIFYMLKTFTMKQIDLMRNEVINEIRTGVKNGDKGAVSRGALNLAKLAGTIGLANAGVDYTKRWLTGKDAELSDVMVDTALRNYGLSSYTTSEILRGNIGGTIGKVIAPPLSVIENPLKEAMGVDTKGRWVDTIPFFGRSIRTAGEIAEEHF